MVARLASQDNIPFSTIASSSVIRPLVLKYTGENVPYSPNTIRKITMRAAALTRSEIRAKLERYQLTGGSFSIAFDEATARNAPHRYISLSVFAQALGGQQEELRRAFHLGLIQVSGSVTADVVADAVEDRLLSFGVNMRSCHFACTDAASTMISAVAKLGLSSQLFFVHGLHNALAKVSRIETFRNVSCQRAKIAAQKKTRKPKIATTIAMTISTTISTKRIRMMISTRVAARTTRTK